MQGKKSVYIPREEFAKRLDEFMDEFLISNSDMEKICGYQKCLSRTSIHRMRNNGASKAVWKQALPMIETSIADWAVNGNFQKELRFHYLDYLFPHRKEQEMSLIKRCELTAGAVKWFGLEADPFDVDRVPGKEEIFTNSKLDEIFQRIVDAVNHQRWVVVSGGVGEGKTAMRVRVERTLAKSNRPVHLIYPEFFDMNSVSVGSIARYILDEFGVKCPQDLTRRGRAVREHLTSLEREGISVALVFDECHRLNDRVLTSLKNFWEMTNGEYARLLGIILYGQPRFIEATLRDTQFYEVSERAQILKMPSIQASAKEYLAHKIACAGGDIYELFEPAAIDAIARNARTPLSLGNLANDGLMKAFELEEKCVLESMLDVPDKPKLLSMRSKRKIA